MSEEYQVMRGVNRLEVIDDTGRALVKYLNKGEKLRYELQDDNQTLKIFVDKVNSVFTEEL